MPKLTIERDIAVPVRDGSVLRGDLYCTSDVAAPTLLMRTPYGKENPMGLMVVLDPLKAAGAGYNVFIQDVRGRFASEGDFTPFVNEAVDGYDTIEWIASQSWSNGAVGMYGSSYMAATQLQAAAMAPPALRAICPIGGSSDYYEGRSYRGGACELGSLLSISLFALGTGTLKRKRSGAELREGLREIKALLSDLPALAAKPVNELKETVLSECAPFLFDWLEHDAPGPYWDAIAVAAKYSDITVPMLHITSWFDAFADGAIANFKGMRREGGSESARSNQHLWIGPWGHYMPRTVVNGAGRLGEFDFGLDALTDLDSVQLGWFDHWLRGADADRRLRSPVRIFVLGENRWRDIPDWPAETNVMSLYPSPDGHLLTAPHGGEDGGDAYRSDPASPVPTHGGAHVMFEGAFPQGPLDQSRIEARQDVLVYTSAPFDAPVTFVGDVTFDAWIQSSAPSTDVVATLSVVLPDGRSINLVDGIRRATLTPGEPTFVSVRLGATARAFERGERVRLRIAGSNFPRYDLNAQTGERACLAQSRAPADHIILRNARYPSVLRLPVLAADR